MSLVGIWMENGSGGFMGGGYFRLGHDTKLALTVVSSYRHGIQWR